MAVKNVCEVHEQSIPPKTELFCSTQNDSSASSLQIFRNIRIKMPLIMKGR